MAMVIITLRMIMMAALLMVMLSKRSILVSDI